MASQLKKEFYAQRTIQSLVFRKLRGNCQDDQRETMGSYLAAQKPD